ncbi:MAG: tryptophan-rich sensory protein [Deltaproteobacteria bacterium]|nr:tryptophan-rich sensory protein [Kofleriaceae bacterium]
MDARAVDFYEDEFLADLRSLDHPGRVASAAVLVSMIALCNLAVLLPVVAGEAAYYLSLAQPWWAPEPWVIVPASIGAFSLIGTAAWMVWRQPPTILTSAALGWFACELVLAFVWTPIFFGSHSLGTSFLVIGTVVVTGTAAMFAFGRVSLFAGVMMFVSTAWLGYLAALTGAVWWLNA